MFFDVIFQITTFEKVETRHKRPFKNWKLVINGWSSYKRYGVHIIS